VGGPKIRFSLGAWFSCDEHKNRQEDLFFKLVVLDKRLNIAGENLKIRSLLLHDFCMVNFAFF